MKYWRASERLRVSLERQGLGLVAVEAPDRGRWRRNCNQKPGLLLEVWRKSKAPVVCLDADCIVEAWPAFFFMRREEDALFRRMKVQRYMSSAVSWWGQTEKAGQMLEQWAKMADANTRKTVDPLLRKLLEEWAGKANIGYLPDSYFRPFWRVRRNEGKSVITCNERPMGYRAKSKGKGRRKRRRKLPDWVVQSGE